MLKTTLACTLASAALLIAVGCSSSGSVKAGTLFEVLQEFRVNGESVWEDGTTEGFQRILPKGTTLKASITQRTGVDFVECDVVSVHNNDDPSYLAAVILPPHQQQRPGLKGFSVTINVKDIGTKLARQNAR